MSFKHLFDKAQTLKSLSNKSADQIGSAIESAQYQKEDIIKENRFIPAVNYASASSFARYGSAEKYYAESIDRIWKTYPYDGSLRERLQWENESTEIDLYLYDNLYPRSTGYILMSPAGWGTQASTTNGYGLPSDLEYIYLKGGPHPNPDGMSPTYLQFTGSNYYETGSNRGSNLKYDLSGDGVTLEFWLKKDAFDNTKTEKEVIFDLWNGSDRVQATAVDAIDTTGVVADGGDCTITITIPAANGGDATGGAGAITILLDASETTGTPPAANQIGIGINGESDSSIATLIKRAINNTSNSRIIPASAGSRGTAGVSGITAAEGSSNTQLTLTMDAAGADGNIAGALANVTGPTIVDVTAFTGGDDRDFGRLSLAMDSSNDGGAVFTATLVSGSDGVTEQSIGSAITVADSAWHHYAFSFKNASAGITSRVYVDGALNQNTTLGSDALSEVTGALQATIGALATTLGGGAQYAGKLSGSLDEFRYWKTQRSSQDVGRFWFTQVGGGTNDDPMPFKDTSEVANTKLGVYYKFNEGITGTGSVDSTVLDYSGRVTNGAWTGYTTDSRNTGSAIISSSAATKEFEDPIIYSFDAAVSTLRANLIQSGSDHDATNASMIYSSIPAWITEEDQERGSQLQNLTQIMASYFDTLHLQVESLNKLKDISYVSGSDKANVFAERMLMSTGLVTPELFVDASIIEKLADRSEKLVFEKSLTEVKNLIYKNIYNNLTYIYKSKGTEKAFRNLIRCFGVDDELIKINMYANNIEFDFTTNRTNQSFGKKFVNFNNYTNMDANVYQIRDPGDTTNTSGFISASTELTGGFALTLEAEVIFPEKFNQSHDFYQDTNIISSSLFGVHATNVQPSDTAGSEAAQTDTAFPTDDATNFQVFAVRETRDSSNVVFILTGSAGGYLPNLTSSMFYDVYNNSKWNFAVKISPENYPWVGQVESTPNANYSVEFQGVNVDAGIVVNSFNVTGTVTAPGTAFLTGSRRVFMGAHRTNMTGTVLQRTDVKGGSCRLWLDRLSTQTIEAHAYDPTNYGLADTALYAFPFQASASFGDLPRINTLILNWDFNQNTGSDADGGFRVADISSGSATMAAARNDWLGNILYYQHPGSGSSFAASTTAVTDKDYVVASKQNLPETLESSDMITVLSQQDDVEFTRDSRPQNYFLAFEKSMQQAISDQIINYFASLSDLNTLIGAPVNRYRTEYKGLKHLRQRFFETVSNDEIDFEKFFEYYKWIDGALSVLLGQLAPISLEFDPNVRTLIESHILERSKYQNKFPFLAKSEPDLSGTIGTIATPIAVNSIINDAQGTGFESAQAPTNRVTGMPNTSVLNSWKYDHAPVPTASWVDGARPQQDTGSTWWQNRAERGGLSDLQNLNATGVMPANALADRQILLNAIKASNNRTLGRPYRFSGGGSVVLGGVARHPSQRKGVVYEATAPAGPTVGPGGAATAVDAIDTTGVVADGGDCTITITIPAANGGDTTGGAGAITILLDASETTGTPAAADQIGIGILGEIDSSIATLIKRAINNTSNSRIIPASAGSRGTAGVSGITATEGSSNTQLTLTMDTAGVIGNVAAALANVTGPTIVDVTDFTGGGNPGVPSDIMVAKSADVESLISSSDVYFPSQKVRYGFGMGVQSSSYKTYEIDADGATVAPFSLYSSSISDTLSSEMSNFTGSTIITNMHADLTSDQTDIPMQGPFTEKFVGGRQHRHIELNQSRSSDDSLSMANNFNGLDTRADRPEGFRIQMGYEFTGSNTGSPWKASSGRLQVVSPQYPELDTAPGTTNLFERPKANIPREEYAKRPVNIKNILMTTASLSQSLSGPLEHNRIGNYSKNYEVIQTSGRTQNDPFFQKQSFTFAPDPETLATRGRFPLENPAHGAVQFDGTSNYWLSSGNKFSDATAMDAVMGGAGNAAVPYSVSIWVYIQDGGDTDPVIWSKDQSSGEAEVYWDTSHTRIYFEVNKDSIIRAYSSSIVYSERWNHIVVTFDGGSDNGGTKTPAIWVNGLDLTAATTTSGTPAAMTEGLVLGGDNSRSGNSFKGYMCDFAIWDKVLSATEILEIYGANGQTGQGKGRRLDLNSVSCANNLVIWTPLGSTGWNTFGAPPDTVNLYSHGGKYSVGGAYQTWSPGVNGTLVSSSLHWIGGRTQNLSGNLDYAIPARTGSDSNQTIIVNRFSAPGGYDVSSQGYMDPAHEEHSVYNAMPYRNQSVINYGVSGSASAPPSGSTIMVQDQLLKPRGLDQLSTIHTAHFGADAAFGAITLAQAAAGGEGTVTRPAFYKTQRNARKELQIGVESSCLQVSSSSPVINNAKVAATKWDSLIGDDVPGAGARTFSVSMWVSLNSDANSPLFSAGGSGAATAPKYVYYLASDNKFYFEIAGGVANGIVKSSAITTPSAGTVVWNHIVVTFTGGTTTNSTTMKIYINGVDDTNADTTGNGITAMVTGDVYFGYEPNSDVSAPAMFSNCAIWNTALTSTEVRRIYNSGQLYDLSKLKADNLISWIRLSAPEGQVLENTLATNDPADILGVKNIAPKRVSFFGSATEADWTILTKGSLNGRYTAFVPPSPDDWPVVTGSVYDNAFEQHGVPNADRNYAWITASLDADVPFYGFDEEIVAPTLPITPYYTGNKSVGFLDLSAESGLQRLDDLQTAEYWDNLIGGGYNVAQEKIPLKSFSVSMWIYPTAISANYPCLFMFGANSRFMTLDTTAAGFPTILRAFVGAGGATAETGFLGQQRNTAAIINQNEWVHVAMTYTGSTPHQPWVNSNPPNIFVNGVENWTGVDLGSRPKGILSGSLSIGSAGKDMATHVTVAQGQFEGYMCDFAVWSERLTADEITKIYNDGYRYNLKDPNRPAGLVSWWPMGSDSDDSLGAPITVDGVLYTPAGAVFDELNRAPLIPPAVGSNPTASAEGVAPSASLPLFDFLKNTVPKVSEISAYTTPGLGSPSGAYVPGLYPFQGRGSGTYSAFGSAVTSPNQNYEPPYSTLVESASISFTGMAYNDYAIRYANLDTHVLEAPVFRPNTKSLKVSGGLSITLAAALLDIEGPKWMAGNAASWTTIGAPGQIPAQPGSASSAFSIATWIYIDYSGSYIQALNTASTAPAVPSNPGITPGAGFLDTIDGTYTDAGLMMVAGWNYAKRSSIALPIQALWLIPRYTAGTNNSSSAPTWMPLFTVSGGADGYAAAGYDTGIWGSRNGNIFVTGSDWNWTTGAGGALEANKWYHIVCTYDGTDPACVANTDARLGLNAQKIYINGRSTDLRDGEGGGAVASGTLMPGGYSPGSNPQGLEDPGYIAAALSIGNAAVNSNYFGYPFRGNINDIQIYNEALSGPQVKELFNRRGINHFDTTYKKNLIAWYKMGDTDGDSNVFIQDVVSGINAVNVGLTGSAAIFSQSAIVTEAPATGSSVSGTNEYRYISGTFMANSFVTLNHTLLNLNGPYQNPSWKQMRSGQHRVARSLKEANRISIAEPPPMVAEGVAGGTNAVNFLRGKSSISFTDYVEQPISSRFKPFLAAFEDNSTLAVPGNNTAVRVSYGNNIDYFSNPGLNNKLNLQANTRQNQAYNEVTEYIAKTGDAPMTMSVYASYGEQIYPRAVNVYQPRVRTREQYKIDNIWNDVRRLRAYDQVNSQGWPVYSYPLTASVLLDSPGTNAYSYFAQQWVGDVSAQSAWPLDAPIKYTEITSSGGFVTGSNEYTEGGRTIYHTASVSSLVSGALPAAATGSMPYALFSGVNMLDDVNIRSLLTNLIYPTSGAGAGELQNCYSYYRNARWTAALGSSDEVSIAPSQSVHPAASYIRPLPEVPARIQNYTAGDYLVPCGETLIGFHPWIAPYQEKLSPYQPYADYAENLRLAGKDCSIIPEFRISEVLEEYLGNESTEPASDGFLAKVSSMFSLTGSSLAPETKDFYNVYSTSDFLELFRIVDEDLDSARSASEQSIKKHGATLQATAFTSFLPYKGFYPAERTVKLASYFSQSMGSFLPGTRSYDGSVRDGVNYPAATANQTLSRILLEPLFAPGILFNTIKSGIAVSNFVVRNTASNPGDAKNPPSIIDAQLKVQGLLGVAAKKPGWSVSACTTLSGSIGGHEGLKDNYYEYNFNSSASYQSASINSCSFGALNIGHSASAGITSFNVIQVAAGAEGTVWGSIATAVQSNRYGFFLEKIPFEAIRRPSEYLAWTALATGTIGHTPDPIWGGGYQTGSLTSDSQMLQPNGVLTNTASSEEPESAGGIGAGWLYDTGCTNSSSIAASVSRVTGQYSASAGDSRYNASGSTLIGYGVLSDQRQNKIRWNGAMSSQLYELAIDNFLCETVNFFQDRLTSYVSKEETAFLPVEKNAYYGMRVSLYRSQDDNGDPNFGMYSRATAFGSAITATGSNGSCVTMAHLTPPYYNGGATADIVFQAPYNDRPTLQDIISIAKTAYNRKVENNVTLDVHNSGTMIGLVTSSILLQDYHYNQMQVSASVNIFDKILAIPEGTTEQKVQWLVQSKFETPVFDFYDTPSLPHPTASLYFNSSSIPGNGGAGVTPVEAAINVTSSTAPFQIRGMWHQYGRLPEPSKGVFLGLTDLPHKYSSSHYGDIDVLSLRKIVGFDNAGDKKIGTLAESTVVREAVVVVPFNVRQGTREFKKIASSLEMLEKSGALSAKNAAMIAKSAAAGNAVPESNVWEERLNRYNRQTELLNRYIFPPVFDWLVNRSTLPVFFDAFEFETTFSRKDLQNMWQNLPPESNQKMVKQSDTIKISKFWSRQLFSGAGFNSNTQWLVFKVKQRAAKDYSIFSKQGLTKDIPIVPASIDSPYSFNWPYDYFSLVELLKIDENVEYMSKNSGASRWEDPAVPPTLGAAAGTDPDGNSTFVGDYTDAEATAILNDLNRNNS